MKMSKAFTERIQALEQTAERIYRKQAQLHRDLDSRKILESIAAEEAEHAMYIATLSADPMSLVALGAAETHTGPILYPLLDRHVDLEQKLITLSNETEALDIALALEKETLVFYRALMRAVKFPQIRTGIKDVFVKEKDHVRRLHEVRHSREPAKSFRVKPLFSGL